MSKEEYLSGRSFVNAAPAPKPISVYKNSSAPIVSSERGEEEDKTTSSYFPSSKIPPKFNQGVIRSTYLPPRNVVSTKKGGGAPNYFPTPTASSKTRAIASASADRAVSSTSQNEEDLTLDSFLAPVIPITPFVPPRSLQTGALHTALTIPKKTGPRHDPKAPDAVVLPPPKVPAGTKTVDVVVDPFISRHLRPHQKEGVRFLYECVMGIKEFEGNGAILADEMGLGKTLTVIALIWTLLSRPTYRQS